MSLELVEQKLSIKYDQIIAFFIIFYGRLDLQNLADYFGNNLHTSDMLKTFHLKIVLIFLSFLPCLKMNIHVEGDFAHISALLPALPQQTSRKY